MNSPHPLSSRGTGQPEPVNKLFAIALALFAVYGGLDGMSEVFFTVLVQLAVFEPVLPVLAFVLGIIATATRREFLGVLGTCVLAGIYTTVVFILRHVEWQIVSWAEWTLIRAWAATLLFFTGSVIVTATRSISARR